MDSKKEGEEKFHEIEEDRFDDSENKYFQFRTDEDGEEEMIPPYDDDFMDSVMGMTDLFTSVVNQLISMLPDEMHEYSEMALQAILSSGRGDYKESLKLIREMKKMKDIKAGSGVDFLEGNNYSEAAKAAMDESDDLDNARELMKKSRKAYQRYVNRFEEDFSSSDYNSYLLARVEKARAGLVINECKGIFSATIGFDSSYDFDIFRIMKALETYYMPPEDDDDAFIGEDFYIFETEMDNVVSIHFHACDRIRDIVDSMPEELKNEFGEAGYDLSEGHIQIIVEGKDPSYSAYDLQLVLACIFTEYSAAVTSIRLGEELFPLSVKDSIIEDTDDDVNSFVVFCQMGCSHYQEDDVYILRTHSGAAWGRKDVAIELNGKPEKEDFEAIYHAMYANIKHPLKEDSCIHVADKDYMVYTSAERGEKLLFLKEKSDE